MFLQLSRHSDRVRHAVEPATASAAGTFIEYFRCPQQFVAIEPARDLSQREGYFAFRDAIGYGRLGVAGAASRVSRDLPDATAAATSSATGLCLPFDLSEVVTNLRQEQYDRHRQSSLEWLFTASVTHDLYYLLRPFLAVPVRKHLQRVRLSGWETIPFPRWPVDFSVETLMQGVMALLLRTSGVDRIPFVWFWPDGARSCAIVTHDVEGPAGQEFCGPLMDLNDKFGVKSAFQLVPEDPGVPVRELANRLRFRGFEVNLHDLNHDGYLFHSRPEFLRRAARINAHARHLGCRGFRSAAMYREQTWYDAFEFSYDMSVPNVAHLEPQRGGCCTVMPYFVGRVLELPLTTVQDYSLFHVLGDYSTALWERQIDEIASRHGLITILTHPDYLVEPRARAVYTELLEHLCRVRDERSVWLTVPAEVDRWWRDRSAMSLARRDGEWVIEGPGSERARLAYASLRGEQVEYTVSGAA